MQATATATLASLIEVSKDNETSTTTYTAIRMDGGEDGNCDDDGSDERRL